METNQEAYRLFEAGYKKILEGIEALGYAPSADPNFADTAARAARGLADLIADRNHAKREVDDILTRNFPAKYKGMVISVIYRISLAYIPRDKVLGLSKLSRIVRLMSHAPVLQEDLTHELCALLFEKLDSEGAAVYVEGLHLCMAARGVHAHEARVVTSAVQGVFLDNLATRNEFIKLVTASHPSLI